MTGEIPPERPLTDRCEDLIVEWRERRSDHGAVPEEWAVSDAYDQAAKELEALLDGEEP